MFFKRDVDLITIKERLTSYFSKKEQVENLPISIRDIFIYPLAAASSYGEFNAPSKELLSKAMMIRLIDHIESLAEIANTYHQDYYCELNDNKEFVIPERHRNNITRLLLNEFSLFTTSPLTTEEFQLLVVGINAIAKNLQPNVHLLLSSFALALPDQRVLNTCIYVIGGSDSKLHIFNKARASEKDVVYPHHKPYVQQNTAYPTNINDFITSEFGFTISSSSLFTVTTLGGAKYLQAIDVCFDHTEKHSKTLLEKMLDAEPGNDTSFIPNQVDQVVTSNSASLETLAKIATKVIQIDPRDNKAKPMKNDIVKDLDSARKNKYIKMEIKKGRNKFIVTNPPFGKNYEVIPTSARELSGFVEALKPAIEKHNNTRKDDFIESKINERNPNSP